VLGEIIAPGGSLAPGVPVTLPSAGHDVSMTWNI
jgi:hypothetical protein